MKEIKSELEERGHDQHRSIVADDLSGSFVLQVMPISVKNSETRAGCVLKTFMSMQHTACVA